ncbi:beta-ketoacyl synthase N-terminal-like domain-containing protein [Phytohabitans flavus]|nr:beta-ketoacyl synthase N-terminal-like domain-containing protein [Phytohabitans flavus]
MTANSTFLDRMAGRTFRTVLRPDEPVLIGHLVHDIPVLPGVFLIDLVLRILRDNGVDPTTVELRRCVFQAPIAIADGRPRQVRIRIGRPDAEGAAPVELDARVAPEVADSSTVDDWQPTFTCLLRRRTAAAPVAPAAAGHLDDAADADVLYRFARQVSIHHSGVMRVDGVAAVRPDGALAEGTVADGAARFVAHPVLLDFATLLPFLLLPEAHRGQVRSPYIPLYIDVFRLYGPLGPTCRVHTPRTHPQAEIGETLAADIVLTDPTGTTVAEVAGFRAKRVRSVDHIGAPTANGRHDPAPAASPGGHPGDADELHRALSALVAARLGTAEPLDPDRGFYDLGLDSTGLLAIVAQIERRTGVELYPTLLFEQPTVRELAAYLRAELPQAAAALAGPPDEPDPVPPPPPAATAPATVAVPARQVEPPADLVAVVGLAGRFPMARNVREFWANLSAGRDCVTEVPADRWDWRELHHPEPGRPGRSYGRWGGFLDGHDEFDARFFSITPADAAMMDPQERLFLQTAWEVIEDAGHSPDTLRSQTGGRVGVYAGAMWSDYQLYAVDEASRGNNVVAGSWFSSIPNRVSYALNLNGPSLAVDTACSSALYAIHLAARAIQAGECRAAIAGGVNLSLHPSKYVKLSALRMLSPDGRCRAFGAQANGYVPGEGVGAVLLRPLADALAAGDHVYAVIKASGVHHGGRTGGFSVPNPDVQADLIGAVLDQAGVPVDTITCVEAHGTGTSLGDPIEVAGLTKAWRRYTDLRGYCALGSVKSSIGHLEAAAGVAGLAKLLLSMRHGTIPPTLHATEANPRITFADTPFELCRTARAWTHLVDADGTAIPRRAAISSFGAGGAGVHMVIEEHPAEARPAPEPGRRHVVPLSARTAERLRAQVERLDSFLAERPPPALADIAGTLQDGRQHHTHRLALVVSSTEELRAALAAQLSLDGSPDPHDGDGPAAVARAWTGGKTVDWDRSGRDPRWRRTSLPTYPFRRERHWVVSAPAETFAVAGEDTWFRDHRYHSRSLLPGALLLQRLLAAAARAGHTGLGLDQASFLAPVDGGADRTLTAALTAGPETHTGAVTGAGEPAERYAEATLRPRAEAPAPAPPDAARERCPELWDAGRFYGHMARHGWAYGPSLRTVRRLWLGAGELVADLDAAPDLDQTPGDRLARLLDGAFQTTGALLPGGDGRRLLPAEVSGVDVHADLPDRVVVQTRGSAETGFTITMTDPDGRALVTVDRLTLRPATGDPVAFYEPAWVPAAGDSGEQSGLLLAFDTDQDRVTALRRDRRVVQVRPGTRGIQTIDPDTYLIDPVDETAHAALVDAVGVQAIGAVSLLWPLDSPDQVDPALPFLLCKVLASRVRNTIPVVYAYRGDPEPAAAAAVAGLARTLRLEQPRVSLRTLHLGNDPAGAQELARRVRAASTGDEIELRHDVTGRWRLAYQRAGAAPAGTTPVPYARDGYSYLVTGGGEGSAGSSPPTWRRTPGSACSCLDGHRWTEPAPSC